MILEEISKNNAFEGVEPFSIITVSAVEPISADTVQNFYKTPDGILKERLINRVEAKKMTIATSQRHWAADAAHQLAYPSSTFCERQEWAKDARAYNELITLWTDIEAAKSTDDIIQRQIALEI